MQVTKMMMVLGFSAITASAVLAQGQMKGEMKGEMKGQMKGHDMQMAASNEGDPYTLSTCPVSGDELGDEMVVKEYDGREVRFCCTDCITAFEKKPDKYWEKINAMQIKQQLPWYPMKTCVVSGEELKSSDMGDPINYIYKNRLVRFCCTGCIKKFEKDPTSFLAKIDAQVIAQQKADYPLKKCLISGKPLVDTGMGEPIDVVISNRLVRFCCAGCPKKFMKDPAANFAVIDKAYGENLPSLKNAEAEVESGKDAGHDKNQQDNHDHGG